MRKKTKLKILDFIYVCFLMAMAFGFGFTIGKINGLNYGCKIAREKYSAAQVK